MRSDPIMRRIEALEEENEFLRQRAERAEAALFGDDWNTPVAPLTLTQTRIMRLLVKRPMETARIAELVESKGDRNCIKVHFTHIRRRFIAAGLGHLAPPVTHRHFALQTVPREAVGAWLRGDGG